jgi:hypothetical protein
LLSRNLKNEEALAHWEAVAPKERKKERKEGSSNHKRRLQIKINLKNSKSYIEFPLI